MEPWLRSKLIRYVHMASLEHDIKTAFPNELGRVLVSVKDMTITPVEARLACTGDTMAKGQRKSKKTAKELRNEDTVPAADKKAVDDIWKHLGLGHIDLSYACVGYSMDGRPVLNHDELVSLLVNYGFSIQAVLAFIEDFAANSNEDMSPIVMYTANTSAIMTEIKPIS